MSERIAIFPGTFDPITRGHADIVRRSLTIFDEVIVAVLSNLDKKNLFSLEERLELIRAEFADCADRVKVESFSGLLVDFVKKNGVKVVIRGLRAISDYDYEAQLALVNKSLYEDLETLFLTAREENTYVSSSLVRQIASFGGNVDKLVTKTVRDALIKKGLRAKVE
jgi:pantetheine-phosphate adenylyltransferase